MSFQAANLDKQVIFPESIDIKSFLEDLIDLIRPSAYKAGVHLAGFVEQNLRFVEMDPLLLKQLLMNMLGSVIRFTGSNGEVNIRVYASEDGKNIIFEMMDTGFMTPSELMAGMIREARQSLVIMVNHLVELQGGILTMASLIDGQTTYRVILPVKAPPYRGNANAKTSLSRPIG